MLATNSDELCGQYELNYFRMEGALAQHNVIDAAKKRLGGECAANGEGADSNLEPESRTGRGTPIHNWLGTRVVKRPKPRGPDMLFGAVTPLDYATRVEPPHGI
ncbi:hypothetical protein [Promicromonospora sp. NPDC023805]|uniref:hypothetical protein n=1 Tax=Promicromonospora sp. NPDC023805 TaxID=3154696 RepID=UPI0033FC7B4B